jgi:hypothetical protein
LNSLIFKLQEKDIKVSIFREPDIKNQITAIAIEPCEDARRMVGSLPSALKEFNPQNGELINKHTFITT